MKSPFKFLDSYTKNDRNIFFGRDREIEELYHRVFESKIMLVYGVSGTGKSSLIHCGLANKFQETDWLPLVIRRGGNILDSFGSAIKAASITRQPDDIITPTQFKKSVRSLYLDHYKPVFFIFDQFEELFIFGTKDEKRSFIQVIKALSESDLQCRFIFVLREEYMAWITEFEKYIHTIFSNRVRIEKMSHMNAVEAIKGPCRVAGIELEEGFAEALLEKLSPGSSDVELTYLQVFLDSIFNLSDLNSDKSEAAAKPVFTFSLLSRIGNVSDLLGSFLEEQVALMSDPDSALTILKSFVSAKGTKRPATETETIENVRSLGKDISPETIATLLQTFVKLRILQEKDNQEKYELRHDSLAEKIFEKFSLAEKELLEIKQFIENAHQAYLRRKVLLNNSDLEYISNKDSLLNLNQELIDFLRESRKNQVAIRKTLKRMIAVSSIAMVILLTLIIYAISGKTKESKAVRLAFESVYQVTKPATKFFLAAGAWIRDPREYSKAVIFESFNDLLKNPGTDRTSDSLSCKYLKNFRPASSPVECAFPSEDGQFIYGCIKDSVIVWNEKGEIFRRFASGKAPVINLLMTSNSEYLGLLTRDSIFALRDLEGKVLFTKKIRYNPLNCKQVFRFTNENRILIMSAEHDVELLDRTGKCLQAFDNHKGIVNAVDISDNNQFLATASADSTVDIWHLNANKKNYELYNTLTSHRKEVLSVDLAPGGRYIVSTSSDRSVKVTNINNQITWSRKNEIELIPYSQTPWFPYFAEFDISGSGIMIRSFEENYNDTKDYAIAIYFEISEAMASTGGSNGFTYLAYSPDKQYLICGTGDDFYLASRMQYMISDWALFNNSRLLNLKGKDPFFSPDGKYVYSIQGNHLESWFIDIVTISEIADIYLKRGYKLF